MSDLVSVGMFFLVFCVIYSRTISKDALEILTDKEKNILAQQFIGFGRINQLPLILVFAGYIGISYFNPSFSTIAFVILILVLLSFLTATYILIIKRLDASNLPKAYIKKYKRSRQLYNAGFVSCGLILLYELLI
jgi:hypothetical protein